MMEEQRKAYVAYRLSSAQSTFEAANVMAASQFWNSAVNRLYYAAFYAVNALLAAHDLFPKSHAATKSLFSQHFVKTGMFSKADGRLLSELYDYRQKGDYENIFEYAEQDVLPLFDPAAALISRIRQVLEPML